MAGLPPAGLWPCRPLPEALKNKVAVIGVAKNPYRGNSIALPICRHGRRPLYVTAIGTGPKQAAHRIRQMHGPFRIPTLLRRADELCRSAR